MFKSKNNAVKEKGGEWQWSRIEMTMEEEKKYGNKSLIFNVIIQLNYIQFINVN